MYNQVRIVSKNILILNYRSSVLERALKKESQKVYEHLKEIEPQQAPPVVQI